MTHDRITPGVRHRNLALFVVLATVWGSSFTAIKVRLDVFPPVLFAAFRYDLAGVLSLGYLAVIGNALGCLLYFDLLARLGPIEGNLVSHASSVVAAVTGLVFLGETPTVHTAVGFTLVRSSPGTSGSGGFRGRE